MSDVEYTARVGRAKKIAGEIARLLSSPSASITPEPLKAALGDWAILVVELAQLSHAKFDMSPHDFPALVREVESLRSAVEILKRQLSKERIDG